MPSLDQQQEEKGHGVTVVAVPFPAQGHLNQLLHFSLLLSSQNFPVHFVSSATHNRQARHRLLGWDSADLEAITFHDVPLPPFPSPDPDPNATNKFPNHLIPVWRDATEHLRNPLSSLLRSLATSSRRLILIHDPLISFAGLQASEIPGVEAYKFQCLSAFTQLGFNWEIHGKPPGVEEEKKLSAVLTQFDECFSKEFWEFAMEQVYDTPAEGVILNANQAIEGEFIELLGKQSDFHGKKLFAVGPINPVNVKGAAGKERDDSLEWLDKQPPGSVVYVAFGSTTTISDEQIEQLAIGLEQSGQRFLWVLRDADRADIFINGEKQRGKNIDTMLDFDKRVEGRGLVVRGWAPQLDILGHRSTGAFVSHCGWNSCMEGFSVGVPILAWPMHSDQPRNSLLITEYLKVGVLVRDWAQRNRVVPAEEIEAAINRIMVDEEGKKMKERAKELGERVRAGELEDLKAFVAHITR